MIYLLIALQVLDLLTTVIALRNPRLGEGNSIGLIQRVMSALGTLPALLILKGFFVWWLWYFRNHPDMTPEILAVLCIGYAAIVANNIKLIRGHYGE